MFKTPLKNMKINVERQASMLRVRRHAHAAMEISHDACELEFESGQILKQEIAHFNELIL